MKKKLNVVTGKAESLKDISEIITGRKANKFAKYKDRASYKSALFQMTHVELYHEVIRLGEAPSSEKEFCRNKCLALYDSAQKPRTVTHPDQTVGSIEDIIAKGKGKS